MRDVLVQQILDTLLAKALCEYPPETRDHLEIKTRFWSDQEP